MTNYLSRLNAILWGAPALVLILGVGIYLSIRLDFVQLTDLPRALKLFCRKLMPKKKGEGTSSFQSLCTALAATVGTGNLVGVAGAICLGGPGSIFWMWICGIFGMVTKYAEATLAVRYRRENGSGGPMYVIEQGLGKRFRPLAVCYAAFGLIAAFGIGNAAQVNAAVTSLNGALAFFGRELDQTGNFILGILLALLIGPLLLGGAKPIGRAAEKMVPVLAGAYILMCAGFLTVRAREIPGALDAIFRGAVSPKAVTGGMLGSAFQALRVGCSRGVFTNEAGMGTAAIAHASAQVSHPAEQGLMGIIEVFLDTIVICTLTALVIFTSGIPVPYGTDGGAVLTTDAFASVYGRGAAVVIALALSCFALATVLGWSLYGARCAEYLFGPKAWQVFALFQTGMVVLSAVLDTALVWALSETVNGLMAIPNLIALAALAPEVRRLTKDYKERDGKAVRGGNYADFHQRQPL